jgi:hypothetical protein
MKGTTMSNVVRHKFAIVDHQFLVRLELILASAKIDRLAPSQAEILADLEASVNEHGGTDYFFYTRDPEDGWIAAHILSRDIHTGHYLLVDGKYGAIRFSRPNLRDFEADLFATCSGVGSNIFVEWSGEFVVTKSNRQAEELFGLVPGFGLLFPLEQGMYGDLRIARSGVDTICPRLPTLLNVFDDASRGPCHAYLQMKTSSGELVTVWWHMERSKQHCGFWGTGFVLSEDRLPEVMRNQIQFYRQRFQNTG